MKNVHASRFAFLNEDADELTFHQRLEARLKDDIDLPDANDFVRPARKRISQEYFR